MMTRMRTTTRVLGLAALIAMSSSCGDVVRDGRSPVYLVIELLQAAPGSNPGQFFGNLNSDVITNVTSPAPVLVYTHWPAAAEGNEMAKSREMRSVVGVGIRK